jgi:hypothetical protein
MVKKPLQKKAKKGVKKGQEYVCDLCRLVVTVCDVCGCETQCDIVCCEQPMKLKK